MLNRDQAWEQLRLALPTPLVPARRCPDCRQRVPEEYARYHGEELLQLRDALFSILVECGVGNGADREPGSLDTEQRAETM